MMASSSRLNKIHHRQGNRVTTVNPFLKRKLRSQHHRNSPEIATRGRFGFYPLWNTMNHQNHQATHSKVISHVFFTGTAKQGCAAPPIGLVDIGASEAAYIFRVSLPGIEKNQNKIKCEIQREGRVCIQGVVPEIAIPSDSGCLYRMQVQQLCPPGPFSITFNLPGQVDPRLFSPKFRPDGIFEVVVVKLGVGIPTS